jgi:hypothetical protein
VVCSRQSGSQSASLLSVRPGLLIFLRSNLSSERVCFEGTYATPPSPRIMNEYF